jgi:hypothetical protein
MHQKAQEVRMVSMVVNLSPLSVNAAAAKIATKTITVPMR